MCRWREGTAQPPASARNIPAPPPSLSSSRVPSAKVAQAQVRHERPEFMAVINQRGKNCVRLCCFIAQAKAGPAGAAVGRRKKPSACWPGRPPPTARDCPELAPAAAQAGQSAPALQEEFSHSRHKFRQFLFSASTQLQVNRVQVNRNDLIII